MSSVELGGRTVGAGLPCLVVAEAGVNHNGRLDLALELVDAAAAAGAAAVKFQTFRADAVASPGAARAAYQVASTGSDGSQAELLAGLELAPDDHRALAARAAERGILFLSTPFDRESVELLVSLDVPALKVASPDLTNTPLLRQVARSGRPVLLSTGMADLDEVEQAVSTLEAAGCDRLVLLHCTSAYPAPPDSANLRAMETLRRRFDVPVGFSDHTEGTAVALAAVALGAAVLEKHLTLDRSLPGPDHALSIEPAELAVLVAEIVAVESALGDGEKRPAAVESELRILARRSLAAARDLPAGTTLTDETLVPLRPATGLSPVLIDEVVGRRLTRGLAAGELLAADDLE